MLWQSDHDVRKAQHLLSVYFNQVLAVRSWLYKLLHERCCSSQLCWACKALCRRTITWIHCLLSMPCQKSSLLRF